LTIVVFAVLAALASLLVWQNYKASIETAEARALSSAQVVSAHVQWMMEASDQALQRIDAAIGEYPVGSSADTVADIETAVVNLPKGFQYSVYNRTGRLTYSSVPEAVGIDVSDRLYFQRLRDGAPIVVSRLLEERLSGEQVFVVARAIIRDGIFHGAASIAIPTKTMEGFWDLLQLGPRSTVALIRSDGWLVARYPKLEQSIDLSETPFFDNYLPGSQNGFYHNADTAADGLSRIVGYQAVDNWPLIAATSVAKSESLTRFWVGLGSSSLIAVPLVLLLGAGMLWILRLLRSDVEQRKTLEQALEKNNFLMREIHHRVKNNLQAVSSLVRLQPLPLELKDDLSRRIAAMGAIHEQIYGADQFEHIDMAPYVSRLVNEVAESFPSNVTIEERLEPLRLGPDHAMPLGLAVNELVTNAFKHAFKGKAEGRLLIELTADDTTAFFAIQDDGPGYPSSQKKGLGTRLIDGFVGQLRGKLNIDASAGTRVVISFPLK